MEVVVEDLIEDGFQREALRVSGGGLEAGGGEADALDAEVGSGADPVLSVKRWSDDEADKEDG